MERLVGPVFGKDYQQRLVEVLLLVVKEALHLMLVVVELACCPRKTVQKLPMPPCRPPRSRHFLVLPAVAVDTVAVEAVAAVRRYYIQGYHLRVVVVMVALVAELDCPTMVALEVDLLVVGDLAAVVVVGCTADWTTYCTTGRRKCATYRKRQTSFFLVWCCCIGFSPPLLLSSESNRINQNQCKPQL